MNELDAKLAFLPMGFPNRGRNIIHGFDPNIDYAKKTNESPLPVVIPRLTNAKLNELAFTFDRITQSCQTQSSQSH
jgi:hypothetical protein